MKKYTNEEISELFNTFCEDKYSLIISSTSNGNEPLTNYTPFVKYENKYYVVMSSAMPHFNNIKSSEKAHVFIIEDEKDASHIFARKRMYFSSQAKVIEDDSYFELFDKRYGENLSFIKTMKDFKIIELTPKEKSLVLGFGAAYKMDENGELVNKNISHK